MRFADEIDGLAGEAQELDKLVERLDTTPAAYGMGINAEKTKLMTNNADSINTDIRVCDGKLETVNSFEYIGSTVSDKGSRPKIISRIAQTTVVVIEMRPIWNDRNVTLSSKIRLMRS